jgi:hypothetical protein
MWRHWNPCILLNRTKNSVAVIEKPGSSLKSTNKPGNGGVTCNLSSQQAKERGLGVLGYIVSKK